MAAEYDPVSNEQVTVVLSPTQVQDMSRFLIRTKPSGALVWVNVPVKGISAAAATTTLRQWALSTEAAMRLPGVVASRPEQDVGESGLLEDYQVFTVQYVSTDLAEPGPFTLDVRVLARYLASTFGFEQYVADPIAAAYDTLRAIVEG